MKKCIDIKVGDTFGRLKVLQVDKHSQVVSNTKKKPPSKWKYICQCSCGTTKTISYSALTRTSQPSRSCGCLLTESRKKRRKFNQYEVKEGGIIEVKFTNCEDHFLITKSDIWALQDYCWYKGRNGYATACDRENWRKHIYLHRLLMGFPEKPFVVDHINRDKLDNKRANLRITDCKTNSRNSKQHKGNNLYRGVEQTKQGRFMVTFKVKGKKKSLGTYDTPEDAYKVRIKAEEKYWGKEVRYRESVISEDLS